MMEMVGCELLYRGRDAATPKKESSYKAGCVDAMDVRTHPGEDRGAHDHDSRDEHLLGRLRQGQRALWVVVLFGGKIELIDMEGFKNSGGTGAGFSCMHTIMMDQSINQSIGPKAVGRGRLHHHRRSAAIDIHTCLERRRGLPLLGDRRGRGGVVGGVGRGLARLLQLGRALRHGCVWCCMCVCVNRLCVCVHIHSTGRRFVPPPRLACTPRQGRAREGGRRIASSSTRHVLRTLFHVVRSGRHGVRAMGCTPKQAAQQGAAIQEQSSSSSSRRRYEGSREEAQRRLRAAGFPLTPIDGRLCDVQKSGTVRCENRGAFARIQEL